MSQDQWNGVRKLFTSMELLRRQVDKELPIQQLSIYLLVVQQEGLTMRQIAKELSLHPSAVSRNVKWLGRFLEEDSEGGRIKKGRELLFVAPNEYNRREFSVFLTDKGRKFATQLDKINTESETKKL